MNIKVRAGLEVVGFFVGALVVGGLARFGLDYLASVYGTKAVFDGATFCLLAGAMYFIGSIMYDMRVTKLKYQAKLKEMVDQKSK